MALKTTSGLYPVKKDFISEYELEETERLLNDLKSSQSKAASLYKDWVEQRLEVIENIDSLEAKFAKCHRACNVAHGVGAALEIVGGISVLAGTILTACGQKAVGEFLTKKVSPVTIGTGVATSVSSSLADAGITFNTMREVRRMMEKDQKYTDELEANFQNSKKIDSYLMRIFNCSTLSDIFLDVVQLCRECIPFLEVAYDEFSEFKNVLKRELKGRGLNTTDISDYTETIIQNVFITLKNISMDRRARDAVKNICDIIQESPLSIEFIKLGLRVSIQICDVLKVDLFTSLLGISILKTSAGVLATNCLLGSILIAVNVLSVISAANNAQKDSSKYSKVLKELSLALTFELNAVRKKYLKLLENDN